MRVDRVHSFLEECIICFIYQHEDFCKKIEGISLFLVMQHASRDHHAPPNKAMSWKVKTPITLTYLTNNP